MGLGLGKDKFLQRLLLLLGLLCLFITPISQAQTPFFEFQNQYYPHLKSLVYLAQPMSAAHWELVRYKFNLTLAVFLFLAIILGGMFTIDLQLKKRIMRRFAKSNNGLNSVVRPFQYPAKKVVLLVLLFLAGLVAFFFIMIFTYESYENQLLVKWIGAVFFMFTLLGGYFFGNLKRSKQLEVLINQLQLQIIDKKAAQDTLMQSEQRLQRQNISLAQLATKQLDAWHNPESLFREIAEVSANALDVERVSIWQFSDDQLQLECLGLYLNSKKMHTVAKPLDSADLPIYFSHLADNRVLAVNDIFQNTATSEFTAEYLQGNGIGAMLDGTIWLNNEIIGVICHEHVGGARNWTLDEQSFVGSIADLARLTIETHKRQQAEKILSFQQKNLESIVKTRIASIESNAKLFRFLVERAPVAILYMDIANEIIEMNPEAERITGYSREFAIGKSYDELFSSEETKLYNQALIQKLATSNNLQGEELLVRCADGSTVELSVSRSMEMDADGNPMIISIGQDMSEQKALEASLIKAREAAESADRIKSMFVASMSHELRTPLNSIIGFLSVVLQGMSGELNMKQKDQLGRAYHSAKHLLSLISDVIDISKIEAGFLQVHEEKVYLKQLFIEVQHVLTHLAEEKKLILNIECSDKLQLETDRKRLYQVVLNVVSNALKYTERGSVQVTAEIKKDWLSIQVVDTGIGIAAADLDNLFKPFERIDSKLRVKTLGTGLGLYLTRKILSQLLGGTIEVKSVIDEGSIFTIKVPLKIPKTIKQTNISILEEHQQKHLI